MQFRFVLFIQYLYKLFSIVIYFSISVSLLFYFFLSYFPLYLLSSSFIISSFFIFTFHQLLHRLYSFSFSFLVLFLIFRFSLFSKFIMIFLGLFPPHFTLLLSTPLPLPPSQPKYNPPSQIWTVKKPQDYQRVDWGFGGSVNCRAYFLLHRHNNTPSHLLAYLSHRRPPWDTRGKYLIVGLTVGEVKPLMRSMAARNTAHLVVIAKVRWW